MFQQVQCGCNGYVVRITSIYKPWSSAMNGRGFHYVLAAFATAFFGSISRSWEVAFGRDPPPVL